MFSILPQPKNSIYDSSLCSAQSKTMVLERFKQKHEVLDKYLHITFTQLMVSDEQKGKVLKPRQYETVSSKTTESSFACSKAKYYPIFAKLIGESKQTLINDLN